MLTNHNDGTHTLLLTTDQLNVLGTILTDVVKDDVFTVAWSGWAKDIINDMDEAVNSD